MRVLGKGFSMQAAMKKLREWRKKLGNRYRLTVLDDETLEEVVSLQLTKGSLYIGVSTLAVFLVLITGILLSVTPLRYYIPGYGDPGRRKAYISLNMKVDSLQEVVNAQSRYLKDMHSVLEGQTPAPDTTRLPDTEAPGADPE